MLIITILLGITMILDILETGGNYDIMMAITLCVALYHFSILLLIIAIVIFILIGINYYYNKYKGE